MFVSKRDIFMHKRLSFLNEGMTLLEKKVALCKKIGLCNFQQVYEDEKLSFSMEVGIMAFCSFPTNSAKMFWFDFHLVQNIMRASLLEMVF